jgi:hypothetical protein
MELMKHRFPISQVFVVNAFVDVSVFMIFAVLSVIIRRLFGAPVVKNIGVLKALLRQKGFLEIKI